MRTACRIVAGWGDGVLVIAYVSVWCVSIRVIVVRVAVIVRRAECAERQTACEPVTVTAPMPSAPVASVTVPLSAAAKLRDRTPSECLASRKCSCTCADDSRASSKVSDARSAAEARTCGEIAAAKCAATTSATA